jgi:hypothetical protein
MARETGLQACSIWSSSKRVVRGLVTVSRSSLVLLLIITLLVGMTARSFFERTTYSVSTVGGTADLATADVFYDALNAALAGGAVEPLAALLSDVFVDHDPHTGVTRSAGEFLDDLRAMGAAPQGVQLEPISAEGSGTTVVVAVEPKRVQSLQVAELWLDGALPEPYFETLRIVQGKLVDRWAPPIPWLEIADSQDVEIWVPAMTRVATTLMRVTVAGGMVYEWTTVGAGILTIESGVGRWGMSSNDSGAASDLLEAGDLVAFPAGDRIRLRSVDGNPVKALLFLTAPVRAADLSNTAATLTEVAAGISRAVLWSGPLSQLDSITRYQPWNIELPANTSIELRNATEVLIAIDTGTLDLFVPDGTVTLLGANRWPHAQSGQARIDANHAGVVSESETVTISNQTDRPVTLFVLTIETVSPA